MDGSLGIIFSENRNKVLLVKRRDIPIWTLPGGGIEKEETPEEAAVREVFEETGYTVDIMRKVGEYSDPHGKKSTHTYECGIRSGQKRLSNESKAIEEFEVTKLPEMISPYDPLFINDALKNEQKMIIRELPGYGITFWLKGLLHPWALFKYLLTVFGIHWNT